MTVLDPEHRFASLSVRDLVEARDAYHYHLMAKPNVVGTAIGRYLIEDEEPGEMRVRTLFNSSVRQYSWPCVLVFVENWEHENAFGAGGHLRAWEMVPKTLYMPDGRAVPVCVVEAKEAPHQDVRRSALGPRPRAFFGAGLPITIRTQNVERQATAGCLVTDGHTTYVLTARHACGEPDTRIFSRLQTGEVEIGTSSKLQLTRKPFSEVYPDFPGRRSYVSLDVGLVRIHEADAWTSNTYGLPKVGALADVYEQNLSLRLLEQPVIGFGAASGLIEGQIKALFYRHRSVGGYEYVGDFLIAPAKRGAQTLPGDSGMVWHLDVTQTADEKKSGGRKRSRPPIHKRDLRPLAVEWGGQVFQNSTKRATFAVATSLSNVCKLLDVELVTDLDRGVAGYWGRTGHYSVAAAALDFISDKNLKKLLDANMDAITFDRKVIASKGFDKSIGELAAAEDFVPLADVPDEVWKHLTHGKTAREGGRDLHGTGTGSTGPEHPNHYADIDVPYLNGKSLRKLCLETPDKYLTVAAWTKYYDDLAKKAKADGDTEASKKLKDPFKRGLLPFRVWQLFDILKDAASRAATKPEALVDFVAAAGVAAHYVGDACQPLHGSVYSDGDASRTVTRHHPKTGEDEEVRYGEGVHSAFETNMVAAYAQDILDGIPNVSGGKVPLVKDGNAMAYAILELMDQSATTLAPMRILDAYEAAGAGKSQETLAQLWSDVGDDTIKVMALGARYLACLWESAWKEGKGEKVSKTKLVAQKLDKLMGRYDDPTFAQSFTLADIGSQLK